MIKRVFLKIRQNGFRWFIWRLNREIRNPSSPILKIFINNILNFQKQLSRLWIKSRTDEFLYAVYDLDVSATTFNIVEFLIDAEFEANRRSKEGFVIVFIPRSYDPLLTYEEYDSAVDETSKQWRFQNLVVPVTYLSEKCKGVYTLPTRSEAISFVKGRDIHPELYDGVNLRTLDCREFFKKLDRPNLFDGLRAPKQGLKYIQSWISNNGFEGPVVTITIRNYKFDTPRNSNMEAWSKFATYLSSNGFQPVVIPDTDVAFEQDPRFDGIPIFRECAWNIGLQASLYESAFVNFFVSHGCSQLAAYNPRCKYILMNFRPEESIVATDENFENMGINHGDNFKFATEDQEICYKPDSFENIVVEFEKFLIKHKNQTSK